MDSLELGLCLILILQIVRVARVAIHHAIYITTMILLMWIFRYQALVRKAFIGITAIIDFSLTQIMGRQPMLRAASMVNSSD